MPNVWIRELTLGSSDATRYSVQQRNALVSLDTLRIAIDTHIAREPA